VLVSSKSHRKAEHWKEKLAFGARFSRSSGLLVSLQAVTRPAPTVATASQISALMVRLRG
jgi:hypothetical protein